MGDRLGDNFLYRYNPTGFYRRTDKAYPDLSHAYRLRFWDRRTYTAAYMQEMDQKTQR